MLLPDRSSLGWKPPPEMRENLYHELEQRGYVLRLLHPGQTHHFHQQRGLRAKTDRLDAMTIARVLLSGEARMGYIPGEQVATYRELVRLHTQLSEEAARYQNQIQVLVVVLFPEFNQVTARSLRTGCLGRAQSVSARPGGGRGRSRGGVPGITSHSCDPFRSPHCSEIGGGCSDVHQ